MIDKYLKYSKFDYLNLLKMCLFEEKQLHNMQF